MIDRKKQADDVETQTSVYCMKRNAGTAYFFLSRALLIKASTPFSVTAILYLFAVILIMGRVYSLTCYCKKAARA